MDNFEKLEKIEELLKVLIHLNSVFVSDKTPPKFKDPENRCGRAISIQKNTLPGKSYAEINFETVKVTDNSGDPVDITCFTDNKECPYEMGKKYEISIATELTIKFKATDSSGNSAYCIFKVTVKGKLMLDSYGIENYLNNFFLQSWKVAATLFKSLNLSLYSISFVQTIYDIVMCGFC